MNETSRVLFVEDNLHTQFLVKKLLKGHCKCAVADNAQQALRLARQDTYDLALIDIDLGSKHDGMYVLDSLREMDGWENVPFMAVTAHALPQDRERFLEAGFDFYLSKPFAKEELRENVAEALELCVGQ